MLIAYKIVQVLNRLVLKSLPKEISANLYYESEL